MKTAEKIIRPIALTLTIMELIISFSFVIINVINPKMDYNDIVKFAFIFGITLLCSTLAIFTLSACIAFFSIKSGEFRVLSIITAVASAINSFWGLKFLPVSTLEKAKENIGWFSGIDLFTPAVFITLISIALITMHAIGIKLTREYELPYQDEQDINDQDLND